MRTHFYTKTLVSTFLAAVFAISLHGKPLAVGDQMPQLSGTDQHEKEYAITADTRYVLVSFEMGPGKQANSFLDEKGAEYLPKHKAVYVANIHGMPGIIANTFALPKMRKYAHRILVMNEEGLFDEWPQEKGNVAVFTLDGEGKISAISQWSPKSGEAPF